MESYLFGVPKPWRVALTRLRIGLHNLQVNIGRHHNPSLLYLQIIEFVYITLIEMGEEY